MIEYLFIPAAIDVVGVIYDAVYSEVGIKAGYAVEGNTLITKLFGTVKPSAVQLYVENFAQLAIMFGLAAVGVLKGPENIPYVAFGGGMVGLLLDALHHIQGGLKWRYLLRGGVLDADGFPLVNGKAQSHNAFQIFLGPWLW